MKYKAHGELFETKKPNNTPTVPVATDVMRITDISGNFTQRQRKLFALLVHNALNELETQRTHKIKISDIYNLFHEFTGTKSHVWIWEELENLSKIKVSYESPKLKGFTLLIASAQMSKEPNETDTVIYEIPAAVSEVLINPISFGRLRTHFLIGLKGKYSVSLYQYLESKINLASPIIMAEIDDVKTWLGVTGYSHFSHLRDRVLDPAVNEINDNPFSGKFTVSYTVVRGKRNKATHIEFHLEKDKERIALDKKLKNSKKQKTTKGNTTTTSSALNPFNIEKLGNMLNKEFPGCDKYALIQQHEPDFRKWLYDSGKSETVKCFEAVFIKYLKGKKAKNEL